MSESDLALLILACPLAATLLAPLLSFCGLGRFAHIPAILGFVGATAAAVSLLIHVTEAHPHSSVAWIGTWFQVGSVQATVSFGIDPLAAVMLVTVTFIASWIALFSAGYMRGDEGFARYFTIMSLFVFSMCLLVLANNFLLLLAGWEGVGLCSYLLVGYYYAKPSAAAAARKAFLVTRLGDTGLLLGLFLLWQAGGYSFDFDILFANIVANPPATGTLEAAALLIFCGAVGKSAQLPLYVWLPDAMEGPTPVSALIHAATMVTAGVYLLARCSPLFVQVPLVQVIVAMTGALTAFLAAFIAITQTDLKRVLAYSTVSQLGFMFMALGTAGAITPSLAITAAIFHLFTHAFFKALLFLGSGSVMHAMGNVIDMRKFGGLRRIMPVTHLTFLCGSAALAGLPLLSGFFSKDLILDALDEAGTQAVHYKAGYWMVFGLALLTAAMTAFYTFRAYFLTFWGPERVPAEAGDHAHESPRIMTLPLIVLAIGAIIAGFFAHSVTHFLGETRTIELANEAYTKTFNIEAHPEHHFSMIIATISTLLAVGGTVLAALIYRNGDPGPVPASLEGVQSLSYNKAYVDEVYGLLVVKPAGFLAQSSRYFDTALDSLARLIAVFPRILASVLRPLQNGLAQFYALSMILGITVFVTFIVFRVSR